MTPGFSWQKKLQGLEEVPAEPLNIRQQAARLEIRRNFFSYYVVKVWNKIRANLEVTRSLMAFKNGYAKYCGDRWLDQRRRTWRL